MFKKVNPRTFNQLANETTLASLQPQESGRLLVLICGLPQAVMGRKEGEKGWNMETPGGGSGPTSLSRNEW